MKVNIDTKYNGKGYDENGNIIYEIINGNGTVKEYWDNGKLRFEGEYLNGQKNRKCKEYTNGNLIFEGEYVNGEKNGKCKEYDYHGKLIFEGEYILGHKLKGKEYINEKLVYEGDYLYGIKWNGKGYDNNGNVIYELINGNGKMKEFGYNR